MNKTQRKKIKKTTGVTMIFDSTYILQWVAAAKYRFLDDGEPVSCTLMQLLQVRRSQLGGRTGCLTFARHRSPHAAPEEPPPTAGPELFHSCTTLHGSPPGASVLLSSTTFPEPTGWPSSFSRQ
ncbi:uncharacterized protein VSU04_004897 isoform 1-T1 [Chlamydotis macqueenii]